ncbi:MAG: Hsp20/alpha crystallin family protein [Candidatus Aenigmatarchaeota archaeon]|mgnify:CR=1 FL=1|nr:MAG: Hsp20/alpha crystallin family protein [Candidatus Aenigmarchaeota archaeon]
MARKWSIWDEMREIQSQMDDLFGRFFGQQPTTSRLLPGPQSPLIEKDFRQPLADVIDKGNEILARIEMPGIDKKDINITTTQDGIEIRAEKKDEYKEEDKKKGRFRLERSYAGFYRYFDLPEEADRDNIQATCKNGVLELKIPKKQIKKKETKKIEVK